MPDPMPDPTHDPTNADNALMRTIDAWRLTPDDVALMLAAHVWRTCDRQWLRDHLIDLLRAHPESFHPGVYRPLISSLDGLLGRTTGDAAYLLRVALWVGHFVPRWTSLEEETPVHRAIRSVMGEGLVAYGRSPEQIVDFGLRRLLDESGRRTADMPRIDGPPRYEREIEPAE